MSGQPPSNTPEWSVSDLSGALKRTLEDAYGHVRVRGELGGVKRHSSGHVYLDLKDDKASLAGVIWRGSAARLRIQPETGMEVIATGRITTFPGQSKYQLIIDTLEPAGVGALLAQLEERRRRLAAEGLFDAARKKALPFLPEVIGVVTSPTGAVIRDILHRLADRFPRRVLVWPVRVQGETSAAEVAAAIAGFNALPEGGPIPRPDLLIVARGGGSLEDLWGFNDEIVVRAAAASGIPLVSAVGHETDTTLIDHAADMRAPTPTGAAEMAVPVRSDLMRMVGDLAQRHRMALRRHLELKRQNHRAAVRALPRAEDLVERPRQKLDLAAGKLQTALVQGLRRHATRATELVRRLDRHSPRARLASARAQLQGLGKQLAAAREANLRAERERILRRRERLDALATRAATAHRTHLHRRADRLAALDTLMRSISYESVLARGFALVERAEGGLVKRAGDLAAGDPLVLRFADGSAPARVTGGDERPQARARTGKTSRLPVGQGSLFEG
ncbi:MAG: exodeoxyribonuclease VII large subunit [Alsobacter sp.]